MDENETVIVSDSDELNDTDRIVSPVRDIGVDEVDERLSKGIEEDKNRRWNQVLQYMRRQIIIEGTLSAIEPDAEHMRVSIATHVQGFRVVIPDSEYFYGDSFREDYLKAPESERYKRRFQKARARLGSRVSFVIIAATADPESGSYAVAGSRVKAMERKRDMYFFDQNIPETRKLDNGSVIEGRVLSAGRDRCVVECFGVETIIPASHLSSRQFVRDCRKVVAAGDVLRLTLTKISADREARTVALELTARTGLTEMAERAQLVRIGTFAQGQVVSYNEKKKVYTAVTDDEWMAAIPKDRVIDNETLFLGDWVSVCVKAKSRNGYNVCTAQRIHRRVQ